MEKSFSALFFGWMESNGFSARDVAKLLNKEAQTVFNWRTKGVPKSQVFACQSLMDQKEQERRIESAKNTLVLHPTYAQFSRWNKAALESGMTIEDWAFSGMEMMADRYFAAMDGKGAHGSSPRYTPGRETSHIPRVAKNRTPSDSPSDLQSGDCE
ncbi:MAG: hypothetical protein KJO21_02440 [Verrucomicrobiae bacterium]|nr:hypothetical protein [Verrucomicrobiae bacterium]NNJ44159.1 hypothetical protein [Akkermansiaceae bacterium]